MAEQNFSVGDHNEHEINERRIHRQMEAFQAAINGAPLEDSLNIMARLVNEEMQGAARTAFYTADIAEKYLRPVWGAGNMPEDYLKQTDGLAIGEDSLACGLAMPTGKPVLTPDVFEEPLRKPWMHVAQKFNYRGCWSFPIKTKEEEGIGTFALYFQSRREATPDDIALVEIVTQTVAVVISHYLETQKHLQVEEALRKSEENYRTKLEQEVRDRTAELKTTKEILQATLDSSLYVIQAFKAVRNQEGKIIDFIWIMNNQKAIEQNGDVIGESLLQHNPGVVKAGLFDKFVQVTETGIPVDHEVHYTGEQFNGWFHQTLVKMGDGFVMNTENISEKKEAREEIKKSRELLKTTIDSSIDMIQVFEAVRNEQGEIVDFVWILNNEASECNYGDVIGKSLLTLNPGIMQEGIFDTFKRVVETGIPDQSERHYVHEQFNGWFYQSTVKLNDGVTTTTSNITERKNAEEEILRLKDEVAQKATDKYRKLFNSIDEGFEIVELIYNEAGEPIDFLYLETNPAFERQTGLKNVEGKLGREVSPNIEAYWLEAYDKVVKTGEPVRIENYNVFTQRWYSSYGFRVGNESNRMFAVLFNDITERKRREQRQAFLLKFSDMLRTWPDEASIKEGTVRMLGEFLNADRCWISEVFKQRGYSQVAPEHISRPDLAPMTGIYKLSDYPEVMRQLMTQPIVIEDVINDPRFGNSEKGLLDALSIGALLVAPLRKGADEVIWALVVTMAVPHKWTEDDRLLLEDIAERTWAAVERAKAEQALAQSEEKYRTLFNSIDEGVTTLEVIFDDKGRAVDWLYLEHNPSMNRLTGMTPDSIGKRVSEVVPGLEPQWIEATERVVKTGVAERFEYFVAELGNRWFEAYFSPAGGEGSHIVVAVYNNITERKRREANALFLNEVSQDLAHLTSIDETMKMLGEEIAAYLNLAAVAFAEITKEEIGIIDHAWHRSGMPNFVGTYAMKDFVSPEVLEYCRTGKDVVIRDVFADPRTDGEQYKALNIGSFLNIPLVRDDQWRFLLVVYKSEAYDWPKEEIAKAEEALAESEEKYRTLFNSIDEGFAIQELMTDENGNVTDLIYCEVNKAFEQHTGMKNATGKKVSEFVPHLEQHWLDALTEVYKTGKPLRSENYTTDLARWITYQYLRIGGPGSRFIAAVFNDVTERKRRDQQREYLLKLNDVLRSTAESIEIEEKVAATAMEYFAADRCYYCTVEGEESIIRRDARKTGLPSVAGIYPLSSFVILKKVVDNGVPFVVHDARTSDILDESVRVLCLQLQIISFIDVPVMKNGKAAGILCLVQSTPRTWNDSEIKLVAETAERMWAAVERARAEEALIISEERLRTLADAVPQVIWANDATGKANYFNQRWYEYTGLTYQQSFGLGWQAIVHPDDALASIEKWKQALAAGKIFDTEYRLRGQDGNFRWFIGRNVPLKDAAGKVAGWFGSATDIEDLKKMQEELSQSETRLKITMESATDYAVITMDTSRRIERWSSGAVQIFGYTEAEVIGQPADLIFTEEDRAAGVPQKEMETAKDTGRAADERWHRRKNGSRFYVSGVMRPIQNDELTGYVKVARDMTQQQLFTEELHRLVAERTVELQRSNEDLRQFAHVASHDLKEPIRKIQTFNNRILDEYADALPARAKSFSQKIGIAADRMISMIEGVLRYSKLGKTEQVWEWVNLNETVRQITMDLELLIQQKGAEITMSELPTLMANPTLMHQLFYNLISNSLKFAKKEEPPRIRISFETVSGQEKAFAKISLSDNGIGIEPEFSEEIFKTFTRLHPAEDYEGTGLGLALCKKIVERHGGAISATGEPGVGATFTILLPL